MLINKRFDLVLHSETKGAAYDISQRMLDEEILPLQGDHWSRLTGLSTCSEEESRNLNGHAEHDVGLAYAVMARWLVLRAFETSIR